MKKIWLFALLFILVKAQAQVDGIYAPTKVIPPSPDAGSLFKIAEIPVDPKNGTANINVPIYTIKDGRIEIPISITYNTVGVKVQEVSGMVGLGWNLDFGGAVLKQGEDINMGQNRVQFTPDTTATKIINDENYTLAYQLAGGLAEKTMPEFFYHFGEYSGSFFYDVDNILHIKSDNPNIKIQKLINYSDTAYMVDYVSGFQITTDEGIEYTFSRAEYTLGTATHVSDFLITQIFDPNSNKTVAFKYKYTPNFIDNLNQSNIENYMISSSSGGFGSTWQTSVQTYNQITHESMQIDSIIFSNGYIKFFSLNDRKDGNKVRIDQINVYDINHNQIKSVQLYQNYFVDTHSIQVYPIPDTNYKYRLRLDSLGFFDNNSNKIEGYSFVYNQINPLPAYKYTVSIPIGTNYTNCTGVDFWGFYNGKLSNQGLVPSNVISSFDRNNYKTDNLYEGDRSIDTIFAQTGVLNKVKYPSGGSAVFTYESNRFDYPTGNTGNLGQFIGGLRIKSISYFDNDTATLPSIKKTFSYALGALPDLPPTNNLFTYDKVKNFTYPDPNPTEGCIDAASVTNTLRFINSSPIGSYGYLDMSPVYGQVTEYIANGSQTIGKTIYYNSTENQVVYTGAPFPEYNNFYAVDKGWIKNGLLDKVEYYKSDSSGNYYIVKSEQYTYTDNNVSQPTIGVLSLRDDIGDDYFPADPTPPCYPTTAPELTGWYSYFTAFNTCGVRRLTQKQVTDYTTSGNLTTITNYSYDPVTFYLVQQQTTDSKGNQILEKLKYPKDAGTIDGISVSALAAADTLIQRNMINTVLEKQEYVGTSMIARTRNNYAVWTFGSSLSNIVAIQNTQTQTLSNSLDTRIVYSGYNSLGNLITVAKANDKPISYIWGYQYQYPVAEIINANLVSGAGVAYASFEDGTYGTWDPLEYNIVTDPTAPMGNRCFIMSGAAFSAGNLNSSAKYILSYWSKNGSYTISGSQSVVTGKTINGWTFYSHSVSGVTSLYVSGNGSIDELRLYPATAQMKTYAYSPLVGITYECDENNKITSYKYDSFNRLSQINDQDGNIIKTIQYHYKNQW